VTQRNKGTSAVLRRRHTSRSSPIPATRLRHVVEGYKVHALVVERVVQVVERLAVGVPVVRRRVVLAGQESNVLHFEAGGDLPYAPQPRLALGGVVGRVRQVPGEDDEVRLDIDRVIVAIACSRVTSA
jgi:hypothetical protein